MTPDSTDGSGGRDGVHHDRKATTAADTFHDEPTMDVETALELLEKLPEHGYDVRLCVEACHEDSAIVKTIDNQQDADVTLANIAVEEDYPKEGDDAE